MSPATKIISKEVAPFGKAKFPYVKNTKEAIKNI